MSIQVGTDFMLFGVRIDVDPMRKVASMNNLSDYQHVDDLVKQPAEKENPAANNCGYVSDNVARARAREKKRGSPWSEEEHKRFLVGLKKVGKGEWRGISKNFVKTRTPTQVASHAQKYFLRHNTVKRRRRSSLFDITTEMVSGKQPEQHETTHRESESSQPHLPVTNSPNTAVYPLLPAQPTLVAPISFAFPLESSISSQITPQQMLIIPSPPPLALQSAPLPNSNSTVNYSPLSLNLSLSLRSDSSASPNPALKTIPGFANQKSYISVA